MSMAIKASTSRARAGQFGGNLQGAQVRAALQGDPGLFGFIGKALTTAASFIPGPIGTIAGAIREGLSGGPGGVVSNGQIISRSGFQQTPEPFPGKLGPFELDIFGAGQKGASLSLGANGESTAFVQNGNGACPVGRHLNKSSYFLNDGTFIQKGSRCVKNRRRNPLNPRAASRAISRLESAKKATRSIDRFSIKCRRHSRAGCKECR